MNTRGRVFLETNQTGEQQAKPKDDNTSLRPHLSESKKQGIRHPGVVRVIEMINYHIVRNYIVFGVF